MKISYGWIIVACSLIILVALGTLTGTFSIFLEPLANQFQWERGALSAAFSICTFLGGLFAIFTGKLSDRYGPRLLVTVTGIATGIVMFGMAEVTALWQVYLLWGLLGAVAMSCCIVPVSSTIPRWFTAKRGLAISLGIIGMGRIGSAIARRAGGGLSYPYLFEPTPGQLWVFTRFSHRLGLTLNEADFGQPAGLTCAAARYSCSSPQGQVHDNLVPDLFLGHVLRDRYNIVDGRTDGLLVRGGDEAGHLGSGRHPLVGETNHSVTVIGDEDPALCCGPNQNLGISSAFGQGVLNTHQVDLGQSAAQPAEDIAVDVGITGQSEHRPSPWHYDAPAVPSA